MYHHGLLFLTKLRPIAITTENGVFELQLVALDRLGPNKVEPWRLVWRGPAAQLFWNLREDALLPGTALHVQATCVRAMPLAGGAEIVARVDSMEIVPQRPNTHANATQSTRTDASNQQPQPQTHSTS